MNGNGTLETVALDLGGVLLTDGTKTGFRKLADIYDVDQRHLTELWHDQLRIPAELGHATAEQTLTLLADAAGGPVKQVEELFLEEFQPIPEGVAYLKKAHNAGSTILLATNHVNERLDRWADRFDWWSLLDEVACSATVGVRKPQPEFYEQVIAAAGGAGGFLFVDDAPENVKAAGDAGLVGVHAVPGAQSGADTASTKGRIAADVHIGSQAVLECGTNRTIMSELAG